MKLPTTTFKDLHEADACTKSYRRLAKALGGLTKYGRTTPITCLQILDACGLDDLEWVFDNVDNLAGEVNPRERLHTRIIAATDAGVNAVDAIWTKHYNTDDIFDDELHSQAHERVRTVNDTEMKKQTAKLRKYLVKHGG